MIFYPFHLSRDLLIERKEVLGGQILGDAGRWKAGSWESVCESPSGERKEVLGNARKGWREQSVGVKELKGFKCTIVWTVASVTPRGVVRTVTRY